MNSFNAFFSGFSLGLSLILAIGAQNAFVLKQGIKKQHVFLVCTICALSDAVLIFVGVSGFGYVVERYQVIKTAALWGGFVFLSIYGLRSLYSAFSASHTLTSGDEEARGAAKTALLTLAFTWLNPHVYLDTALLLGSVSTKFGERAGLFGVGAMCASFAFFFSLGYGARFLAPLFQKPAAWKILEFFVGVTMITLGAMLVIGE
ncbi:L-lysine exporter [Campylobacter rectus RM3267]|uniref:Transporter, LysE family n=2 Tax=Campylobacter rectus TaxID=203 RepID=A0A6G5QLK0_CAMRE|nr:LysE/ArgO family amino acid transporter [Campylobacter rectus]EEF12718.1 L-lysine exporter [Campylobacter rectus RM3267]QCD46467.1 transporter, LysE family [Campylobacter rectus]UEB47168.1 LysE/ArgO family amino acid transporter [Campylobacter rectus]